MVIVTVWMLKEDSVRNDRQQKTPRIAIPAGRGVVKVAIIAVLIFTTQHGESMTQGNIWQIAMTSFGMRPAVFWRRQPHNL